MSKEVGKPENELKDPQLPEITVHQTGEGKLGKISMSLEKAKKKKKTRNRTSPDAMKTGVSSQSAQEVPKIPEYVQISTYEEKGSKISKRP